MLNNIVDKLEQCGQHNIVQCCFHQARTGCAFFAVYLPFAFNPSASRIFRVCSRFKRHVSQAKRARFKRETVTLFTKIFHVCEGI